MNNQYEILLTQLQNADESEREWIVMQFSLQNLPDILKQAVWAAAIPHWFDNNYLNAILGFELSADDFTKLINLSFIEPYAERGFNVHERSRELLLTRLWKNDKTRYQKLSKKAFHYCSKQNKDDSAWRIETLYHDLLTGNKKAEVHFIEQTGEWYNNFQFDKLENLVFAVNGAVKRKQLIGEIVLWIKYWQASLDIVYSNYESAKGLLNSIVNKIKYDELLAYTLEHLGDVYKYLSDYSNAVRFYQKALIIYKKNKVTHGEAKCNHSIGDLHCYSLNYIQAQQYYQKALDVFKKENNKLSIANCTFSIADIYYILDDYSLAKEKYQLALIISCGIKYDLGMANSIAGIGKVYFTTAQYPLAQQHYEQALFIYKKTKNKLGTANRVRELALILKEQKQYDFSIEKLKELLSIYSQIGNKRGQANCLSDLAEIYKRQQQFGLAFTYCNKALAVFPYLDTYLNRADLYLKLGYYYLAENDIKQANTLVENSAEVFYYQAELTLWQKQINEALDTIQQALARRPKNGGIHAIFSFCLLANEQTQQAIDEMKIALTFLYHQSAFEELLEYIIKFEAIYQSSETLNELRQLVQEKLIIENSESEFKN